MARVTVEDCIDKVESPYELVLVAKERATQLNSGLEPTVDRDNDKNTVISLREIAEENIKVSDLTESAVYKLRKHVQQVDDTSETDEEIGDDFDNQNILSMLMLHSINDDFPEDIISEAKNGSISLQILSHLKFSHI